MSAGSDDKLLAALKWRCENDLEFLCTKMLGLDVWQKGLHDELAKVMDSPDPKKLILVPRGHFKSTICTIAWPIQQLLKNHNIRILITNAVRDRSLEFLRNIVDYLIERSPLAEIYGRFDGPGSRFTQEEITIAQKKDPTKRGPSIRTAGLESSLTGSHPDIIIHDDLVEESNIGTKDQIQKVIRFYQNSLDLLSPGGKVIVVGTRWAQNDLYGHILENEMDTLNGIAVKPEERAKWRQVLQKSILLRSSDGVSSLPETGR